MRIIKEIPHTYLKITVFKHGPKIQIKIQHQVYETLLTFRDGEIDDLNAFLEFLPNSKFIQEMGEHIYSMHQSRMKLMRDFVNI